MDFLRSAVSGEGFLNTWSFVVRATIIYLVLVALIRSSGQRGVRQLTAVDFVIGITIGSIFANPLANGHKPLAGNCNSGNPHRAQNHHYFA